jgi:HAD superfamily hydrolase (TIGR01456 family)
MHSIDGALLRSSIPLPGATEALRYLHDHDIPFILLTNGGGKTEGEQVRELSMKFSVPLTEENFVQSHTPFKEMAIGSNTHKELKDKTILVTGGEQDRCRNIAETYGYNQVITPGDILMAYPTIWPFNQLWTDYYVKIARPLPKPINPNNESESLKVDAIFVFNDPRDWALDCQLILDFLLSREGILGTYSSKNGNTSLPNHGWQQDSQPTLIFSNPDLFWAAAYHMPRLGQGGFRAAFEGLWKSITGGARLTLTQIGKPHPQTYLYAERVLQKYRKELFGRYHQGKSISKLNRVYMIGDNPESDIRGANEFKSPYGTEWNSILVKTGVYSDGAIPMYKPDIIVENVMDAVRWALKKESHSMVVD